MTGTHKRYMSTSSGLKMIGWYIAEASSNDQWTALHFVCRQHPLHLRNIVCSWCVAQFTRPPESKFVLNSEQIKIMKLKKEDSARQKDFILQRHWGTETTRWRVPSDCCLGFVCYHFAWEPADVCHIIFLFPFTSTHWLLANTCLSLPPPLAYWPMALLSFLFWRKKRKKHTKIHIPVNVMLRRTKASWKSYILPNLTTNASV